MIKIQGFRCRMCLTGRDNKDLVLEIGEVIEGGSGTVLLSGRCTEW